jgi:hypothetical protein
MCIRHGQEKYGGDTEQGTLHSSGMKWIPHELETKILGLMFWYAKIATLNLLVVHKSI